jgi:hypothetical protein
MDVREAIVASAKKPSSHFGSFRHLLLDELSTPKGVLRVLYSFKVLDAKNAFLFNHINYL